MRPHDFMAHIIKTFEIKTYYQSSENNEQRVKNLYDLYYLVKSLDDTSLSPRDAIQLILQYTTMSSTELFLKNNSKIPIITVHQAKGMEFDYVFVAGLMEGVFPSYRALQENRPEEEKRTFYVAITRAKKKLFLSHKDFNRNKWNKIFKQKISRFINDIPQDLTKSHKKSPTSIIGVMNRAIIDKHLNICYTQVIGGECDEERRIAEKGIQIQNLSDG